MSFSPKNSQMHLSNKDFYNNYIQKKEMTKIIKPLVTLHYAAYLLAILIASFGMNFSQSIGISIDPLSELGISISSILIIVIIGSVPASLWLFHKKVQTLQTLDNTKLKVTEWAKFARIRLIVLGIALNLGVMFFYILQFNKSMLFCAGIAAIGMVFSKPSEIRLITDLLLNDDEIEKI